MTKSYDKITHPLTFFKDWTADKFKFWLKLDKYGMLRNYPKEQYVVDVYFTVEPFEELGYLQDICLEELVKLKQLNLIKNESRNDTGKPVH